MKLFHFRGTVFSGLSFVIGIGLSYLFRIRGQFFWAALLLALLFALCVWFFSLRNESAKRTLVLLSLLALFGALGAGRFALAYHSYRAVPDRIEGEISGRIVSRSGEEILLDRVTADGEPVAGRVRLSASGLKTEREEDEEVGLVEGARLTFSGRLSKEKVFEGKPSVSRWIRRIRYTAYTDTVRVRAGAPSFFGGIRKYLREGLTSAIKGDASAAGLALFVGDTGELEELDYRNFQNLGILHIFAVSGLHFSVLFFFLYRVFRKILPGKWGLLPVAALLAFYAGVCDFSPSVLRALCMIFVYMGAKLFGRRYDPLSALFVAVFVVTAIQPFHLFSAGFVLSCAGVLSIVLLAPPLARLFRFLPARLGKSLSVCLAAQLGLIPVVSYYFGKFYTLALFVNLLIAPVVGLAFLTLFLFSVFLLPFPALYFLFSFPRVLLEFLLLLARLSESAPVSLALRVGTDGVLLGFCLLVLCSDYMNLRALAKGAGCVLLCLCFAAAQGLALFLRRGDRLRISEFGVLFVAEGKTVFADAGGGSGQELAEYFSDREIRSIGLWLCEDPEHFLSRAAELTKRVRVENVCFPDRYSADDSGVLVYAERHFGIKGHLAEPQTLAAFGAFRYGFSERGGTGLCAAGVSVALVDSPEQEAAVGAFLAPDLLFAAKCGDYLTPEVFCRRGTDCEHAKIGARELIFRLKSGIMEEIGY